MNQPSQEPLTNERLRPPPINPRAATADRKPRGCLFWGCATILCLVFLLTGLLTWGGYKVARIIRENTDEKPLSLPAPDLTDAEIAEVKTRVDIFLRAMQTGQDAPPLTLTEDEATAFLWESDEEGYFRDNVLLRFPDDRVAVLTSVPLSFLPFGMGTGRYLNAAAAILITVKHGVLFATLDSLTLKDHRFTEKDLAGARTRNLAKELYEDVDTARMLARIQDIRIGEGLLHIELTPAGTAPPAPDFGTEQTDV
ncbi:MAG: hypothetical protein AB1921_07180 [Thermodesulfobacteriota bacterium]